MGVAIVIIGLFIVWLITLIWGLLNKQKLDGVKKDVIAYKLEQNKLIVLYVFMAKENRRLIRKYNGLRSYVTTQVFNNLDLITLSELMTAHGIDDMKIEDIKEGINNPGKIALNLKESIIVSQSYVRDIEKTIGPISKVGQPIQQTPAK